MEIDLTHNNTLIKHEIIHEITKFTTRCEQIKLESFPQKMTVSLNIMIPTKKKQKLEEYLVREYRIDSFVLLG